jgi:uncharacterized delta-60 repeat protein
MNKKIYLFTFFTLLFSYTTNTVSAQISEAWSLDVNSSGDFSDKFTCVTTDQSGNYLAAGSTVTRNNNKDYLVVKFNTSGDTIWKFSLDGGNTGPDEIAAIVADNAGNIYVTGYMKGYYTGYDMLTVKLNTNGDTLWTRKYNYSNANDDDIAVSICLDNSGNVIIAGYSDSDPSSFVSNDDAIVLKYSSAGSLLWSQRYNGLNNGVDRAVKVATNSAGEIYVAGRTDGGDDNYLLIKYSAAGSQIWLRAYDSGNNDRGTCMTLDNTGNIYLSGRAGNGVDHDMLTLKYNPSGTILFNKSYDYLGDDRATAITVDASGNVYVTGQSDGDISANKVFDYATLKYNSTGTQQWVTRYTATNAGDDIPYAIAVSSSGDVWVTGISDADASLAVINNMTTVKYNSTGVQQFVKVEGVTISDDAGLGILVNASGKAIVVGFTAGANAQPDATLIQYTTTGTLDFKSTYAGFGDNQDEVNALTLSSDGNILAAGYSVEKDQDFNFCVSKVSLAGNLLWKKTFSGNSTSGSTDNATAIVCDASGNIYATGYTKNSNAGSDYTTFKMNQNGDTLWSRKYSFSQGAADRAVAIALDPQNNIVVTGYSDSDPSILTNYDFATIKYSPAGTQLWAVRYNGVSNVDDRPTAIKIASNGNIYIVGRTFNGLNDDVLLLKYNSNGILQWNNVWSGGAGDDRSSSFTIDANENSYIVGRTFNGTDLDALIIKCTTAGQTEWFRTYSNNGISDDRLSDVAIDENGNIVVAGQTDTDASIAINLDLLLRSYTPTGNLNWSKNFNVVGAVNEFANSVICKSGGIIIAAGAAVNSLGKSAPLTVRFNANGDSIWYGLPNFQNTLGGVVNDLVYSGNAVYTGGFTEKNTEMSNLHFQKYNDQTTGIKLVSENSGINIWPIPTSNILNYSLNSKDTYHTLQIIDLTGRVIWSTTSVNINGIVPVSNLNNGYYVLQFIGNKTILNRPFTKN